MGLLGKKKDLKPIEIDTPKANKMRRLFRLTKLPILKQMYRKKEYPDGFGTQAATPIPINVSLNVDDQVLPFKVAEYFIEKAGTILLMDCPCRTKNDCQDHDHSLGCTWFGRGAGKIDLDRWPGARLVTKEEALEHERKAYENGLIPHLGKLRGDARIYGVLEHEHEFMNICHCCSCCCVASLFKYGSDDYKHVVKRMEGVEARVDTEKCIGCGECFKVCIYDGLKMKKDKTSINQDNCMGCGRCVRVCPNEAISISIDDYTQIDKLIARFEERVDISN